jgi:hypothetical protein
MVEPRPWEAEGQYRHFVNLSACVKMTGLTIGPDFPMHLLMDLFKKLGVRSLLVSYTRCIICNNPKRYYRHCILLTL